ncbi:hypothetical protein B0H66DRAFT_375138 [Apodospora peruviana]|uniref:Uncharacterized protein n=1 Tax=Apodospora peruviana TaxID=516989 RepID=A0AAE0HX87_9PEZI|nr:hypothetical protein B0H66DRAFT_375138 [Apodospora peruviana]
MPHVSTRHWILFERQSVLLPRCGKHSCLGKASTARLRPEAGTTVPRLLHTTEIISWTGSRPHVLQQLIRTTQSSSPGRHNQEHARWISPPQAIGQPQLRSAAVIDGTHKKSTGFDLQQQMTPTIGDSEPAVIQYLQSIKECADKHKSATRSCTAISTAHRRLSQQYQDCFLVYQADPLTLDHTTCMYVLHETTSCQIKLAVIPAYMLARVLDICGLFRLFLVHRP